MSSDRVNSPNMKLEVVVFIVSDVDRAKAFYENLGWRLDIDVVDGDFRGVQMTPYNSEASIIFGKGVTPNNSGSAHSLVLAVDDLDAAREDLIVRGVNVSEVFHYAGGPFNNACGGRNHGCSWNRCCICTWGKRGTDGNRLSRLP
ncbi:VOC family protein [Nostoc sp.]|uniref:VOC family protein n=1 Tax=Nostoc sp. TaxID=1180 RepID=UPI002FF8DCE4